jgi:ABC-type branched-subunit amino acid transport system substrate-binding protein
MKTTSLKRWEKVEQADLMLDQKKHTMPLGIKIRTVFICLFTIFTPLPSAGQTDLFQESPQIAILLPLSGEYEHVGAHLLEALQLSADMAAGITWTVYDTGGDPVRAAQQVALIAEDLNNIAIIGPVGTAESLAAAEAASSYNIPLLTLSSFEGIEDISPWIFRMRISPEEQSRQIATIAMEALDLRSFAVLYPNNEFGIRSMDAFVQEVLSVTGSQITGIEPYEPEETNFNDPVRYLVNRDLRDSSGRPNRTPPTSRRRRTDRAHIDFEAIFIPATHNDVSLISHFLSFWDVPVSGHTQLLGISSWSGYSLGQSADLLDGALFTQIFHPEMYNDAVLQFVSSYFERYERHPTEAEAQSYEALQLLVSALEVQPSSGQPRQSLMRTLGNGIIIEALSGPLELTRRGAITRQLTTFSIGRSGFVGPYEILQ